MTVQRVLGNLISNANSCSTSDQSWPLETFTNPSPFMELTNRVDVNIPRSDEDSHTAKVVQSLPSVHIIFIHRSMQLTVEFVRHGRISIIIEQRIIIKLTILEIRLVYAE